MNQPHPQPQTMLPYGQFNPNEHADMPVYMPVPPGFYAMQVKSVAKELSQTQHEVLKIWCVITHGSHTGRTVLFSFNLWHSNPDVVSRANQELATLCRACGVGVIQAAEELVSHQFVAELKLIPAQGNYKPKNEAIFFHHRSEYPDGPPVNPEPTPEIIAIMNGINPGADNGADTIKPPTAPAVNAPPLPQSLAAPPPPPPPHPGTHAQAPGQQAQAHQQPAQQPAQAAPLPGSDIPPPPPQTAPPPTQPAQAAQTAQAAPGGPANYPPPAMPDQPKW